MKTIFSMGQILALTGTIGLFGCATQKPPQDLVNARAAYVRADNSNAAQLDQAGMHAAKQQLEVAEASFEENGDTQDTRDQAYLSVRRTELAESVARTMQSRSSQAGVVDAMNDDQTRTVARTAAELARQKKEVADQKGQLNAQGVALRDEKSRREDAEMRAAQAAADLAKFASVKQEPRGMVITLSGSVLFASGKWDLLPTARARLNDVADALNKSDPKAKFVVEGHTDSKGKADANQTLSQNRAQAVRDYLVSRGIASDRITSAGFGPARSVADNASVEGRANNRRVEIIVLNGSKP